MTDQTRPKGTQAADASRKNGILDRDHYCGIPGLLKCFTVVFSLIAYGCLAAQNNICGIMVGSTIMIPHGYFKVVTMGTAVVISMLWIFLLFKLPQRIILCSCANRNFLEFALYGVLIILYFVANLYMSIMTCNAVNNQVGVVFGWLGFFALCGDFTFAIRRWLASYREQYTQACTGTVE